MPEPDCFLRYCLSAATRNFTSEKSDIYVLAAAARRGFNMVLFTDPVSRRNTFAGGTYAPLSALLVCNFFAVLDVSFAVNSCRNRSFFAFIFVVLLHLCSCYAVHGTWYVVRGTGYVIPTFF